MPEVSGEKDLVFDFSGWGKCLVLAVSRGKNGFGVSHHQEKERVPCQWEEQHPRSQLTHLAAAFSNVIFRIASDREGAL